MISEATLREIGVEDILMFYADSNEFDNVRDAEEELKKECELPRPYGRGFSRSMLAFRQHFIWEFGGFTAPPSHASR